MAFCPPAHCAKQGAAAAGACACTAFMKESEWHCFETTLVTAVVCHVQFFSEPGCREQSPYSSGEYHSPGVAVVRTLAARACQHS